MPEAPVPAQTLNDSTELAELTTAQRALALVETPAEAKQLYDKVETLSQYARRYRLDLEKQNEIGEMKLRTVRKGGTLLAKQVKHGGSRSRGATLPEDFTKSMSSRWQKVAGVTEDDFQAFLDDSRDKEEEITLGRALTFARSLELGIHFSSDTDEWSTPQELFDLLNGEFGFQLDVCATAANAKCGTYFGPDNDGLAHDWRGTCWMNPPYGVAIRDWVAKAHASATEGATVVCLLPARVDTAWWWDHCRYVEIRFIRGRIKFGGGETGAPFPSALVIFNRPAAVVWWEAWPAK